MGRSWELCRWPESPRTVCMRRLGRAALCHESSDSGAHGISRIVRSQSMAGASGEPMIRPSQNAARKADPGESDGVQLRDRYEGKSVRLKVWGELTAQGLIELMSRAGQDPRFVAGMSAIADYRDAHGDWDYSEIQRFRDYVVRIEVRGEVRWAAVVKPGTLVAVGHVLILISEAVKLASGCNSSRTRGRRCGGFAAKSSSQAAGVPGQKVRSPRASVRRSIRSSSRSRPARTTATGTGNGQRRRSRCDRFSAS